MFKLIKKLLGSGKTHPPPDFKVGDSVTCMYPDSNAVVCGFRSSGWSGREILVEVDEPLPYIGVPNPRRKIWMHQSWLDKC
jgi:hypothetical protein